MANSEHFSDKELACHHCGVNGCEPSLVDALERFRAKVGKPVIVDSAYRCAAQNASLPNAARRSQHMMGLAADIRVEGFTAAELERVALSIPQIHAVGRDDHKNYIHLDVRPLVVDKRGTPVPALWCYNAEGFEIPHYPAADPAAIA